jgi:hypothetical protein
MLANIASAMEVRIVLVFIDGLVLFELMNICAYKGTNK